MKSCSSRTATIFLIGNLRLDEGRYRVELASTGSAPQFDGVDVQFAVQIPPKTRCPKKGN